MPLGMKVGLGPCDFVFDGDSTPSKSAQPPQPIFGPCLLWPNGWIDEDAAWYGIKVDHIVLDGVPATLRERGTAAPSLFSARECCDYGPPSQLLLS